MSTATFSPEFLLRGSKIVRQQWWARRRPRSDRPVRECDSRLAVDDVASASPRMLLVRRIPQSLVKESLQPLVMIECPRLLFPFAREIVATAVRDGGFPPLLIDPIDFVGLYRQKMGELQPQPPPPQAS